MVTGMHTQDELIGMARVATFCEVDAIGAKMSLDACTVSPFNDSYVVVAKIETIAKKSFLIVSISDGWVAPLGTGC